MQMTTVNDLQYFMQKYGTNYWNILGKYIQHLNTQSIRGNVQLPLLPTAMSSTQIMNLIFSHYGIKNIAIYTRWQGGFMTGPYYTINMLEANTYNQIVPTKCSGPMINGLIAKPLIEIDRNVQVMCSINTNRLYRIHINTSFGLLDQINNRPDTPDTHCKYDVEMINFHGGQIGDGIDGVVFVRATNTLIVFGHVDIQNFTRSYVEEIDMATMSAKVKTATDQYDHRENASYFLVDSDTVLVVGGYAPSDPNYATAMVREHILHEGIDRDEELPKQHTFQRKCLYYQISSGTYAPGPDVAHMFTTSTYKITGQVMSNGTLVCVGFGINGNGVEIYNHQTHTWGKLTPFTPETIISCGMVEVYPGKTLALYITNQNVPGQAKPVTSSSMVVIDGSFGNYVHLPVQTEVLSDALHITIAKILKDQM